MSKAPSLSTAKEEDEVIRLRSDLVVVPLSVTDSLGQPVSTLKAEDFALMEDRIPQEIFVLGEPGKTRADLALVFDVSGSVKERFLFEQQAASQFISAVLKPKDTASLFSIGLSPRLERAHTSDPEEAKAGVMTLRPSNQATAFFDTVVEAARYLGRSDTKGARKALIVISDGEDNYSDFFTLTDARRELQRADCLFYSINPSGPSIWLNKISQKGQDGMAALAAETGGTAFVAGKIEDLPDIFQRIAAELQTQYLIGFYSANDRLDGSFRRITVQIPARPDLRARARQGYYAQKP